MCQVNVYKQSSKSRSKDLTRIPSREQTCFDFYKRRYKSMIYAKHVSIDHQIINLIMKSETWSSLLFKTLDLKNLSNRSRNSNKSIASSSIQYKTTHTSWTEWKTNFWLKKTCFGIKNTKVNESTWQRKRKSYNLIAMREQECIFNLQLELENLDKICLETFFPL